MIDLSTYSAIVTKSSTGINCLSLFVFSCTLSNNPCTSVYTISNPTKKLKIYTNDFKMVGTVHQITIYASLTTSPPIFDTVGTSFTIKFTSILCSNAYLVYYPIYDVTYDVSLGTKYLIT